MTETQIIGYLVATLSGASTVILSVVCIHLRNISQDLRLLNGRVTTVEARQIGHEKTVETWQDSHEDKDTMRHERLIHEVAMALRDYPKRKDS